MVGSRKGIDMMWWLQRYPDGMAEWSIVLWGRYPKTSMTWTHCLSLSKVRRGVYRGLFNLHRGYWLPAAWFTGENFETVVNPIFWMPLPAPPTPKGGA